MIFFAIFDSLKSIRQNIKNAWTKDRFWCIFDCIFVAVSICILLYI